METGTVKRFNPVKSYGFIEPDRGGDDVHLHARAVLDPREVSRLDRGVRVSYRVTTSDKGLRAEDVRLLPAGQEAPAAGSEEELRREITEIMSRASDSLLELARRYCRVR